jgi:hypothetical protein
LNLSTSGHINTNVEKIDFLLVSHLISKTNLNTESDFYFGDMGTFLKKMGLVAGYVYIDHVGIRPRSLTSIIEKERIAFVLSSKLSIYAEVLIFLKALSIFFSLLRTKGEHLINPDIVRYAMVDCFSPSTLSGLRIQEQLERLIEKFVPRGVLYTYEGHAWERLVAQSTKSCNKSVCAIAYQHNLHLKLQNAVFNPCGFPFDPDAVLTSGSAAKYRFEQSLLKPHAGVFLYGSNRAPNVSRSHNLIPPEATFLVIPEGILSECRLLFSFTKECAIRFKKAKFIWRLHPSIKFPSLFKQFPSLSSVPSNVILSHRSLEDDIRSSSHVVYRSSTAVIRAVAGGLRPLYLRQPKELSVDVLFDMGISKVELNSPDQLAGLIDTSCGKDYRLGLASEYVEKYFSKQSYEALKSVIASI